MSSSIFSFRAYVLTTASIGGLAFLILLVGTEIFLRHQDDRNIEYKTYHQRATSGTAPWLAVGDSHAANGLVSNEWVDNLGQPSDNLDSMAGKIRIRLSRQGLQGVLLQADPQIFSYYRISADQKGRVDALANKDPPLLILHQQYRPYLAGIVKSILSNPGQLFDTSSPRQPSPTRPHDSPSSPNWSHDAAMRVQLHTPMGNLESNPVAHRYKELVSELRQRGITVCMVRFPVSSEYRQFAESVPGYDQATRFFISVSKEFNVRLVDQRTAMPDTAFSDPDHLSSSVAAQFTAKIREACADVNVPKP